MIKKYHNIEFIYVYPSTFSSNRRKIFTTFQRWRVHLNNIMTNCVILKAVVGLPWYMYDKEGLSVFLNAFWLDLLYGSVFGPHKHFTFFVSLHTFSVKFTLFSRQFTLFSVKYTLFSLISVGFWCPVNVRPWIELCLCHREYMQTWKINPVKSGQFIDHPPPYVLGPKRSENEMVDAGTRLHVHLFVHNETKKLHDLENMSLIPTYKTTKIL